MDDDQQFCLRWNNHQSTLVSVFDTLLEKGMHVDCTLAAEGQTLKAHKVVLSACSPYFESVLSQQYDKHPIIILKDVKYAELRAMMDYMYRGEVNISQDQLAALLKAAESLQIKGLSDNKPSRPPSRPATVAPIPTAHPPRQSSPPPQVRDGSIDSREDSSSPTRRRKKRRISVEVPSAIPIKDAVNNGEPPSKDDNARDGLDDLTIDEDAEEQPPQTHNDVVRNFQWHMERSQDEIMNSSDSARESQELHKEGGLPSALLSLLSAQHAQAQSLASLVTPCVLKPTNEMPPFMSKLPIQAIDENIKAHLLQQAFIQNNNTQPVEYKKENEPDSDGEYDDTDDIVLPEDNDSVYENNFGHSNSQDGFEMKDIKPYVRREGSTSDDPSRHFECQHCGKKYRWKSTLRRHENVECGGKAPSHQCPYCSYKAKQRGNLGVHIRKHHNQEWYLYANNKVRRTKKPTRANEAFSGNQSN